MVTLDLRHTGQLYILVLANKPFFFEMTAQTGAPVLTGAAATMIITGQVNRTLTIGAGLTITAANKIAISTTGLPVGIYNYTLEITPLSGEVIRIIYKINASNE